MDILRPRLSWNIESPRRGASQTAYQIMVSTKPEHLQADIGDVWDSGRTASTESSQIIYKGSELSSRARYYWKVRIWDEQGLASDWSLPSFWEMGLLKPADWQAKWIGYSPFDADSRTYTPPAPYLRKAFEISQPITSARAYVCGLGFYELYLNGVKVGDHVLSPNQTNYDVRDLDQLAYPFDDRTAQRVAYLTFDVTSYLRAGANAVGAVLGNGWYNQRDRVAEGILWYGPPRFIVQLVLTFEEGAPQIVVSDPSWKATSSGPMIHNGIYTGERYDARLEMNGWSTASFDDRAWGGAIEMQAPTGRMTAQYSLPDRIVKTITPTSTTRISPVTTHVDFGQNMSGWVRLKVEGTAGSNISLRFIEDNNAAYGQSDYYVLKGGSTEVYEPRFTWHGFRFAEITTNEELLSRIVPEARVVHTDVQNTGTFECSNNLFNQILHNCRWAQWSNMHCGVPSDCPHRERVGYTGDWGHVSAETAIFNFDMARFYTKWINDIADAQNSVTGYVPHSAPYEGGGGGPPWGSALVTLPWILYLYYGDHRVIEEHYPRMKRWVEYLKTRTDKDGIVVREEPGGWDLGEWATPGKIEIPPAFVNTCYYAYVARLVANAGRLLGRPEDLEYFTQIADAAGAAINRSFFDEKRAQYWEGRQGANVFPLAFGLVPEKYRTAVFNRMVEIIVHENESHFDTGIFATNLVLELLTQGGRGDVAYAMMNQHTSPSFGWQIDRGATTLWENWNGESSHNHAMFGGACKWFYKSLAGINPVLDRPGFKHILIRPQPLGDLTFAKAEYQSVHGKIRSSWERHDEDFHLLVEVPGNCSATLLLPADDATKIYEGSRPLSKVSAVHGLGLQQGRLAYSIGSGQYEFMMKISTPDPNQ